MSLQHLVRAGVIEGKALLGSPTGICAALLILPIAGLLTGMGVATAYGEYQGYDLPGRLMLNHDGGFSENFEYFVTAMTALAMLAIWSRTLVSGYLVLAAFFAWLTADNSLQLHENVGIWLASVAQAQGFAPDHAVNYGEAIFMLGYAGLVCAALWLTLAASKEPHRARIMLVLGLVVCTTFFGFGVDLLDAVLLEWGTPEHAIGIFVEDAGEFWGFSMIGILVAAIFARTMRETKSLQTKSTSKAVFIQPVSG